MGWPDPKNLDKIICLTRGNGHYHIMVVIGRAESWDTETLATATRAPRRREGT